MFLGFWLFINITQSFLTSNSNGSRGFMMVIPEIICQCIVAISMCWCCCQADGWSDSKVRKSLRVGSFRTAALYNEGIIPCRGLHTHVGQDFESGWLNLWCGLWVAVYLDRYLQCGLSSLAWNPLTPIEFWTQNRLQIVTIDRKEIFLDQIGLNPQHDNKFRIPYGFDPCNWVSKNFGAFIFSRFWVWWQRIC